MLFVDKVMNIVLVHGIFENGKSFRPLINFLTEKGHTCFAPTLRPFDARLGIEDLASKLRLLINETFGTDSPLVIIGFSMGAIISRYFIQLLDGHQRTKAFFSISAPHQGTFTAYFYPGQGARDMRPNSHLLVRLASHDNLLTGIPTFSYRTHFDNMIIPSSSSHWPVAKNIIVKSPLHRLMVRNASVYKSILAELNTLEQV